MVAIRVSPNAARRNTSSRRRRREGRVRRQAPDTAPEGAKTSSLTSSQTSSRALFQTTTTTKSTSTSTTSTNTTSTHSRSRSSDSTTPPFSDALLPATFHSTTTTTLTLSSSTLSQALTPTARPSIAFGHGPRPGVIVGAVVGSVTFSALVALAFLWYARRMAWCCVPAGARTPDERFEVAELRRPGSAIPHWRPSTDGEEEGGRGLADRIGEGGLNTNINESVDGFPAHSAHQAYLAPPALRDQGQCRAQEPGNVARQSIPPAIDRALPLASPSAESTNRLNVLESHPASLYSTPATSPDPEWAGYTTTTQRLGSRPVSLCDKASEMGVGGVEAISEPAGRMRHSAPGTPLRRESDASSPISPLVHVPWGVRRDSPC